MNIQSQGAAVQPEVPSCPICQAWARPVFRSKIGKNIFRCRRDECRHFFTPAERAGQGVCSRDEDDIELDSERSAHQFAERNRKLLGLFEANIPSRASPAVMLDYGAGAAHVSRAFKSLRGDRIKIFCLEANPICHPLYKKNNLIHLAHLSELKQKVDLVFMIEVIEHLPDPISSLKEIRNVLSPAGVLFLSTPLGNFFEFLTQAFDRQSHLHFFTPRSLDRALVSAGFQPLERCSPGIMYPAAQGLPGRLLRRAKLALKQRIPFLSSHTAGFTRPCVSGLKPARGSGLL